VLELKSKAKLGQEAHTLARGFQLVRYRSTTYMPADYETGDSSVIPPLDRMMWQPLNRERLRRVAAAQFETLFSSDSDLASFEFMVAQNAQPYDDTVTELLVRTPDGLRRLTEQGTLDAPTGGFVPNTLVPMLNTDAAAKEQVFKVIADWLDSEEDAHALLHHLATALSPGWSAVKYVLLLGEGRNGKGLLLKMLQAVFGRDNVSNVTRQHMAEQNPVVIDLNGKLLNIVFDGLAEYVKDSGPEKTLIAGEPFPIRRLYESTATTVQTNALFVEALNHEPKSKDKSLALQKRLMRFHFPRVYALDHSFERKMLAEDSLGAFLSLLIDHFVGEDELATKLAPTGTALQLQLEHMFTNSLGLQFLKHLEETDALGIGGLLDEDVTRLVQQFQSWRIKENDLGNWAEPDVLALFQPILVTERASRRVNGQPRKVRVVKALKPEAAAFIETMKGEEDDVEALVAD